MIMNVHHFMNLNQTEYIINYKVLDNHKPVLKSFGIQTNDEVLELPYIYWIPMMYKNPYQLWYIAGSLKCSTKVLSLLTK